jgi:hypothetical protein
VGFGFVVVEAGEKWGRYTEGTSLVATARSGVHGVACCLKTFDVREVI